MAKDKSEKKEKKDKKEKKSRASEDGVKKEKKEKRKSTDATTAVLNAIEDDNPGAVAVVDNDGDVIVGDASEINGDSSAIVKVPEAALVPFANPLCDEKNGKKVLKTVKKGMRVY